MVSEPPLCVGMEPLHSQQRKPLEYLSLPVPGQGFSCQEAGLEVF